MSLAATAAMTLPRWKFLRLVIGLAAVGPIVRAEAVPSSALQESDASAVARSQTRKEIGRLIRSEVEYQHLQFSEQLPAVASAALPAEDVVQMERVVVSTAKLPELSTPRETRVEEFFRTGTFAEKVGRKVTTRLWMKGDEGLMLCFSW